MKIITIIAALACATLTADTSNVPDSAVLVTTETVTKTVSREPRMVVLVFAEDGTVSAEISYETVTRVDGAVVSRVPLRTTVLPWQQVTNLVPALADGLTQFKAACRASLTNSP
jgi:hypothetical protein